MKFARNVFLVAGVWGIAVLTPLYFLVDITGRHYAPPADYPQWYYGFLAITMAWQETSHPSASVTDTEVSIIW